MRVIDADSLIESLLDCPDDEEVGLKNAKEAGLKENDDTVIIDFWRRCKESIANFVNAESTVVPIKHRHWNRKYYAMATFIQCSNCGFYIRVVGAGKRHGNERYLLYSDEMKFCPNCGAKMEYHPRVNEGGDLGNDLRRGNRRL